MQATGFFRLLAVATTDVWYKENGSRAVSGIHRFLVALGARGTEAS